MDGLIDYVKWVADNLGVELSNSDLNKLTIELIECDNYNKVLKGLQDRIVEVSDAKYFKNT